MANIRVGAMGESSALVVEELTAAKYGSGLVPSFATPALVGLMENAAVKAIEKYLAPGETSVGTEISAKHLAATPVGMTVTARAEVVEVEGRRVKFAIEAWDDRDKIGEGTHWRAVVDEAKFKQRFEEKAQSVKTSKANQNDQKD